MAPEIRMMLARDDTKQPDWAYLKEYAKRGEGKYVEVWVALNLAFPNPDDCRNQLGLTTITNQQIRGVIEQFDTVIYPKMSEGFSVPLTRYGNDTTFQELFTADREMDCCVQVPGEKILVLVDNVRDTNYYTPNAPDGSGLVYVAGFVSSAFTNFHDRNIFVMDAFDWLHRTGPNPPDDSMDPVYLACAQCINRDGLGQSAPFAYESIFAHEYYVRMGPHWYIIFLNVPFVNKCTHLCLILSASLDRIHGPKSPVDRRRSDNLRYGVYRLCGRGW